jgi:hypothetical protein
MGADNQAERVIARIEYREKLAEVFWRAALPQWPELTNEIKHAIMHGIAAVIEQMDRDVADRRAAEDAGRSHWLPYEDDTRKEITNA